MRNFIIVSLFLISACSPITSSSRGLSTPTDEQAPTFTPSAQLIDATATVTASMNEAATPPTNLPFIVRIHPDDGLYIGDLVSFEVEAPKEYSEAQVEIQINPPDGPIFGPQEFHQRGLVPKSAAAFYWVWDTSAFDVGEHIVEFRIPERGHSWQQTVTIYAQDDLPPHALDVTWESQSSECCTIYYLSGTSAERDLSIVMLQVDAQAASVTSIMDFQFAQPPEVVLIPRVVGHGGYANEEIYVSYLDRNYAGSSFSQVLHHEFVHIADRELSEVFRPTMFVEGYAVYKSGGHFKPEPLIPRAAALLDLDWYIPLPRLANNFYSQQHEIGYLQAGSLIEFMIAEWGEDVFETFYRDIESPEAGRHAGAINQALRSHYDISLSTLDKMYYAYLQAQALDPMLIADVKGTVEYYDTVRRYQQLLDTSAHYLTAWFLDIDDMLEFSITADYFRHPESPENITVEIMLVAAHEHLLQLEFGKTDRLLDAINAALDSIANGLPLPFSVNRTANQYFELVSLLMANGYSPQHIYLNELSANVLVLNNELELIELALVLKDFNWVFD